MMSPLKWSLVTFVGAAVLTAGAFYFSLHHRVGAMAELHAANRKLSAEIAARSDALAKAAANFVPVATAPLPAGAKEADEERAGAMPSYYRNEGQATPVATLQTFAWACDRGEVATVAKLLTFQGKGRAKVEAFLQQLPDQMKARWSTPEIAAANICLSGFMQRPYPAAVFIDLAETESVDADTVRLRLPGTALDGGLYQKTDDGWKFVIPEAGIDEQIARYAGGAAAAKK